MRNEFGAGSCHYGAVLAGELVKPVSHTDLRYAASMFRTCCGDGFPRGVQCPQVICVKLKPQKGQILVESIIFIRQW